ncbi:MAG: hypothetical protein WCG93_02930 [Paludibacter sp.]
MKYKFSNLLILCMLSSSYIFSQTSENQKDDNDSIDEKKSFFSASTTFITNSASAGRVEEGYNPSIGASIGYNFKFGGYIAAESGLAPTQTQKFGGFSLQGGYGCTIIKDFMDADISYTHYFSQNTSKVSSEVQGTFTGALTCDLDWVAIDFTPSYSYGSKVGDVLFSLGLNKNISLFTFSKQSELSISPGLKSYAGTQKLLELHVTKKPLKTKKGAILISEYNAEYSKFNYLDTDIEIPISYTLNKFTFELTPILSLPTNLVQTTRFIANPFYVDFSVSLKI